MIETTHAEGLFTILLTLLHNTHHRGRRRWGCSFWYCLPAWNKLLLRFHPRGHRRNLRLLRGWTSILPLWPCSDMDRDSNRAFLEQTADTSNVTGNVIVLNRGGPPSWSLWCWVLCSSIRKWSSVALWVVLHCALHLVAFSTSFRANFHGYHQTNRMLS